MAYRGAEYQVNLEPALDNAPTEVRVDENGQFRLELALARGVFYGGELSFSGTDICSEAGSSPTYSIRLDAVIPTLRITEPQIQRCWYTDLTSTPLGQALKCP